MKKAYEVVDRELKLVADIQRSLLPTAIPPIPTLSIAAFYQTSQWAGGDYYDFFQVTTPYYSFDWGNGHFIVLNSDIGNAASSEKAKSTYWEEQTRWLEEDLRNNQKADYRFVIAHHADGATGIHAYHHSAHFP